MYMQTKYVLGLDGGGTKTSALLANLDGKIFSRQVGPASNCCQVVNFATVIRDLITSA